MVGEDAAIGWLWNGRSTGNPQEVTGFQQGLKEFGYVDGQNIVIDYRFTEGHPDRILGLAAELMKMRLDVLVAFGTSGGRRPQECDRRPPMVSLFCCNPVGAGFIASLARPGGHINGASR